MPRKPTIKGLLLSLARQRMEKNLERVANLLAMHAAIKSDSDSRLRSQSTDILRAAVVFLHAALEGTVRDVGAVCLPEGSDSVLNEIPLASLSSHGRPEKFFLGALVHFKGQTVDAVIEHSVNEYLQRKTYNSARDLTEFLRLARIAKSDVKANLSTLGEMMQRRHDIVHQGDRRKNKRSGRLYSVAISRRQVSRWMKETKSFLLQLLRAADA
jgi:RiboL-PSP-HEPN